MAVPSRNLGVYSFVIAAFEASLASPSIVWIISSCVIVISISIVFVVLITFQVDYLSGWFVNAGIHRPADSVDPPNSASRCIGDALSKSEGFARLFAPMMQAWPTMNATIW